MDVNMIDISGKDELQELAGNGGDRDGGGGGGGGAKKKKTETRGLETREARRRARGEVGRRGA